MSKTKKVTLEDCFSLRARIGWQGLRSDEFIDAGPYLVTGTDFINGRVNWDTCYHVSDFRYTQDTGIQLKENDLVVTKDGTVGKTAFVIDCPERVTLNSHIFLVRAKNNEVVPAYLYYILNSHFFDEFLKFTLTGTTIKGLTQGNFYKFSFTVPEDTKEQAKIAEVLRTIDEVIDKTRELIEKYENIKAGLMQDLLDTGVPTTIETLCSEIIAGGTPTTSEPAYWDGSNVWITPSDLSKITTPFIASSDRMITDRGVKKATGKLIPAGSVILSNRAPVGYVAIPTVPFSCNQGCKGLVCSKKNSALYLYYSLSGATAALERVSSGTTFLELPKRELLRFIIKIPSDAAVQDEIAEKLLTADEKIQNERDYLFRLCDIKLGLMQDLLTQRVSVVPIM